MPLYDYRCPLCLHEEERFHAMSDTSEQECPQCGVGMHKLIATPRIKPPVDAGWENENGGRGRYISQLQRTPGPEGSDPSAYCRSQRDIFEKAARRGLSVERAR